MKIAFCYPGQGVQKIGMAQGFVTAGPEFAAMMVKASEAADIDMAKLMFEENDDINITEFTQPALVTACCIITKALLAKGIKPDITAGLSLGEYCSLYAAGVMSFEDAVRLTRIRGRLMSNAVPAGEGGMAAVIGLDAETIENAIKDIEGCWIANYNCPGQIVITGKKEAVEKGMEVISSAGAKRVVPLNVSGPFHSPLLEKCGEELYAELEGAEISEPEIPYIANVNAEKIVSGADVKELLKRQVYSPVKWEQTLLALKEEGVELIVEVGPGRTIAGFVKKTCPEIPVVGVSEPEDIEKLLQTIG